MRPFLEPLAHMGMEVFERFILTAGKAEVLSREAPASCNLGWLLMENSGLCFTVPFWSLGSQKLSVVLNYSEAHISSVRKKSTPTGKKCHKLFIALCFRSRVAAGSRAASLSAGENPCWPLGINVLSGRGRSRVVHGLVSGEETHSSGTCPVADLTSSFYGARKWCLTHPGLPSDCGGVGGWGEAGQEGASRTARG